jgi:hypothetical protein
LEAQKTEDHFFLLCLFILKILKEVYKWFGLVETLSNTIVALFLGFFKAFKLKKKVRKEWYALAIGGLGD